MWTDAVNSGISLQDALQSGKLKISDESLHPVEGEQQIKTVRQVAHLLGWITGRTDMWASIIIFASLI
jgi:hypothetical protein